MELLVTRVKKHIPIEMHNEDQPQFWEDIYLADDTGWDLNGPTPVFKHLAESLERGRVCIIGCGRGYDAIMFAKKGFDVTAVDFAPSAIRALQELAKQEMVDVNAVQRDIFSLVPEFQRSFDYVVEQTCFCAIHPKRRKEYEVLVKAILKSGGKLIGLWFPLDKLLDEGGPPYGTNINEVKSIFNIGWKIEKEEFPDLSIEPRKGREKLIIFKTINKIKYV